MRLFQKRFAGLVAAALLGTAVTAACLAVMALVMCIFLESMQLSRLLSTAACAAGSFFGSYTGGKYRRRKGLVGGIICGGVMWCIFLAVSLVFTGNITGIRKLLLLVVFSGAGGVSGVNSERPRHLM